MPHEHPEHPGHSGHHGKILVLHATAPTCWWSWGYEAVLNRLRMVYGDQIEIRIWTSTVWDDFDEYMKHYELTFQGLIDWAKESSELMKIPLNFDYKNKKVKIPKTVFPATLAVIAAQRQSHEKAERLAREFLRLWNVELKDVSDEKIIFEAAETAGL